MPHIHDKIDFIGEALVVHENRVLLRMHDKYHVWLQIGGHVELDEDPVQAMFREVKEESGLDVEIIGRSVQVFNANGKDLPAPHFMYRHPLEGSIHEHVCLIYVVRPLTLEISPHQDEKPVDFKWFSVEELSDPQYGVQEHTAYYAKKALEMASR
jgi:8-oxo-dGTP diphosphatase